MAPTVGFWRFMEEVHELMFPMACIDWREIPVVAVEVEPVPTGQDESQDKEDIAAQALDVTTSDRGQDDRAQRGNDLVLGKEILATEQSAMEVRRCQLFQELQNQNRDLVMERGNAIRWQDAASMAIKEAKDEAETRKREAKAAKRAGLRTVAILQRHLDDSGREVIALKRREALVAGERTRTEAEHREEMSVAEAKTEELQTELKSAISDRRESIQVSDELRQANERMKKELVAKEQKLAAQDRRIKVLQDRNDAQGSIIQDIGVEAGKSREACNKYCREKLESEKAQRVAETNVADLQREAIMVKAKTDEAMKALQTQLDTSVVRELGANTRATKAEGDAEQLRRELDNTELARQSFEKKEGEWAALFAAKQADAATPSRSTFTTTIAPACKREQQISAATANEGELSKPAEDLPEKDGELLKKSEQQTPAIDPESQTKIQELEGVIEEWKRAWKGAENGAKEWKRGVRRVMNKNNQTVLATERENIRRELHEEMRKAIVVERKMIRGNAKCSSKARLVMKLKFQKNKELEKLRRRAATEKRKGKKEQVEWRFNKEVSQPVHDAERSQLKTEIQNQLQTEFQNQLPNLKIQWEAEHVALERPRLEIQIRSQLEIEYQKEVSNFKARWEVEHSHSEAGLNSQKNADPKNQIEREETGNAGSTTTRSAEDDSFLSSLSRESDETHELFQEIGEIGLPRDSAAYTVLRGLNQAKDTLYEIKSELRTSDTVVDKNTLLYSMGRPSIDEHYIQQLNPATQGVLIRQANEANRRLEYMQEMLGTNDDVPRDAMLEYLLAPLKIETSHSQVSAAPPKRVKGSGNTTAPGTSVIDHESQSSPLQTISPFGDTAPPRTSKTSKKGIVNPLRESFLAGQPSLDFTSSQNDQDSGAAGEMTKAGNQLRKNFEKTFQPLLPQGEGPAPPVRANLVTDQGPMSNLGNFSSSTPVDALHKDNRINMDSGNLPLSAVRNPSNVGDVSFVSSRPRQAKKSQGPQRGSAPKGHQLAHQAFAKGSNVFASMLTQAQQANPQEQVSAIQQVASVDFPRKTFTLESNHSFGM